MAQNGAMACNYEEEAFGGALRPCNTTDGLIYECKVTHGNQAPGLPFFPFFRIHITLSGAQFAINNHHRIARGSGAVQERSQQTCSGAATGEAPCTPTSIADRNAAC